MYILNITSAIKKMAINKLRDFIFENYYRRIEFSIENSYYSVKQKKMICNYLQLNYHKKYLILVILKNTINNF